MLKIAQFSRLPAFGIVTSTLPRYTARGRFHSQANEKVFENCASRWWDIDGPMALLHDYNYVRLPFIAKSVVISKQKRGEDIEHLYTAPRTATSNPLENLPFPRHANERDRLHIEGCLQGLEILDVGCGGGILSEQLAKSGAKVLGIDTLPQVIEIANQHLNDDFTKYQTDFALNVDYSKNLNYQNISHSQLLKTHKGAFDIVVASEVLEHIENNEKAKFLEDCVQLLKDKGILIITTPGRSVKSCIANILIAEHLLKLVPKNTHHYNLFVSPKDIQYLLEPLGLEKLHQQGVFYLPILRRFIHVNNCDWLYMIAFHKV